MKKGCFVTGIAVITVTIGVGSYIIKKYGSDFLNFGKEKVMDKAFEEFNEYLNKNINNNLQRDSIVAIIEDYKIKLKKDNFETAVKKFGRLIDEAKDIVSDKVIESNEIQKLKKLVTEDERRTKDRN